jgi:hypothetical protein
MIVVPEFPTKSFKDKSELFSSLKEHKHTLIAQKRATTKYADSTFHYVSVVDEKGETTKAESTTISDIDKLEVKLVINTTNLMDSHSDVHLKGIWKKSIKENKNLLLLQEHQMTFDKIISTDIKASIDLMGWSDLGFKKLQGNTEALVFTSIIDKSRNAFMFEQYAKGYVKEHSVGMRYVKVDLAVNSEESYYKEEKGIWDKYINEIANKEVAEELGYFWAVSEAKVIEGSAVVRGSNYATPTLSVEQKNIEPLDSTQNDTEAENRTITSNGQKTMSIYKFN